MFWLLFCRWMCYNIWRMILFTKHAEDKFEVLKRHKFTVSREKVLKTVENPDLVDYSRDPILIAQRKISKKHVLRVVYKKEGSFIKIITFYPNII